MASILKPKRSNVASVVPTTASLADGEIAVNTADKKIYMRVGAAIVEIFKSLTKADVGLDNVDNTSDATKNVLSATKLTTARTIALSGAATGTATSFNGSANISIPVTALNADNLTAGTVPDARLPNTVIKYGDILQPDNPFGGNKLYYNVLGNPLFLSNLRWSVSASNLSSPQALFDGNYEAQASVPAGTTGIVTLDFGGNYSGYPYGTFLLSCYYTNIPESISIRVYCNYAPQGIGWKTLTVTKLKDGASATIFAAYNPYYAIQQVEVTVNAAASTNALITQMELVLDRPGGQAMPVFNKYANETAYKDINWASGTPRVNGAAVWHAGNFDPAAKANLASPALTGTPTVPTAALNTNTTQAASTAYVLAAIADDAPTKTGGGASGTWGISITGSAATLTTARTINGTNFDGSAPITTANWGTARTLTIGSTSKSVNGSTNYSWTLAEIGAAGTGANTFTGQQVIKVGAAATAADNLIFQPTDYGAGKPGFFITKASVADTWNLTLWDGVGNNGTIALYAGSLKHNNADVVTSASGVKKTEQMTAAAYAALGTKDANTLYVIVG